MTTILQRLPFRKSSGGPAGAPAHSVPGSRSLQDRETEDLIRRYGDLVFDLSHSVLQNAGNAQIAFREVFHEVRRRRAENTFQRHERGWVLRIACERIRELAGGPQGLGLTAAQQIELDSAPDSDSRLSRFELCFRRLAVADQLLLLLKDKYGVPMPEISVATGTPEEALKVQRAQILRSLEEWIWSST